MSSEPHRILLVRLGGIGDVVCTLPAVEAVRAGFPQAFIGYAVEERAYDLVQGHPAIDTVHLFHRRSIVKEFKQLEWLQTYRDVSQYRSELRAEHYDLALDFQRNFKGAMHTLASGAKRKIGFTSPTAREFNHWFYYEHVDPAPAEHWVDKFIAMAKYIGGKPEAARYRLPTAPESIARVEEFLAPNRLERFVVVHPGTSGFDLARRWEPDRFGHIATRLVREHNIRSVVTWGPGERRLAETVVTASNGSALLSFESNSLLDLAELYRRATLYIGCDTGPMHIATAVGLPSVVLFGSGNPGAYGPRSKGSKIIAKEANGHLLPMSEITVENVLSAVTEILPAPVAEVRTH